MEIFALYGPSGTGKSTSALALAHKYQIPAIIDDGLLIYQGRKVAGHSAKYEKTTIQAVKRAIFYWPDHARQVKQALNDYNVQKLLILGTSRKMIDRITEALELHKADHYIPITDIRSSAEIKAALFDRETQGRHVIPIPRMQVEQDFLKKFIAKVEKILSPKKEEIGETTIVHPQFGAGKIHVSERVLKKLIAYSCSHLGFISQFKKIRVDITATPFVELDLEIRMSLHDHVKDLAQLVQQEIYQTFMNLLHLEIEHIEIRISKVEIVAEAKKSPV